MLQLLINLEDSNTVLKFNNIYDRIFCENSKFPAYKFVPLLADNIVTLSTTDEEV